VNYLRKVKKSSSVSIHHAPSTINFVTAAGTFSSLGYKKYKTGFSQSSSISPLGKKKSNNFERREEFYDPRHVQQNATARVTGDNASFSCLN
jgi:hypothetical protein